MYVYEPDCQDPKEELEVCMNFYRKLVTKLHIWDLMEFVNYLSARDGVDWALEQIGRENVGADVLAEIEALDAKLRANAEYLVHELELYKHIRRDEPEEYWWWYMDGGKPDGPLGTREMAGEAWQLSQAMPVAALAEERAAYEVASQDERENR